MNELATCIFSVIGLILTLLVLTVHYFKKDGFGRVFLCFYSGTLFLYFLVRLVLQFMSYHYNTIQSDTLLRIFNHLTILLVLPALLIIGLEGYWRVKKGRVVKSRKEKKCVKKP